MNPSAQPLDGGASVDWALVGPALVGLAPVGPVPSPLLFQRLHRAAHIVCCGFSLNGAKSLVWSLLGVWGWDKAVSIPGGSSAAGPLSRGGCCF